MQFIVTAAAGYVIDRFKDRFYYQPPKLYHPMIENSRDYFLTIYSDSGSFQKAHRAAFYKGTEKKAMLVAHGNAMTAATSESLAKFIRKYFNGDIYIFEFPGYHPSDYSIISTDNCVAECIWWLDYLNSKYDIVEAWGYSIGGGIIVKAIATSKFSVKKLYLQSTFSCIHNVIRHLCPAASPLLYILSDEMPTSNYLKTKKFVLIPLVILHSKKDEIIPYSECEINRSAQNHDFIELYGPHNDF